MRAEAGRERQIQSQQFDRQHSSLPTTSSSWVGTRIMQKDLIFVFGFVFASYLS